MKTKYLIITTLIILTTEFTFSDSLIHYRHATFMLEINGKKILVDPMFASKESYPPIPLSQNKQKNPLIDLDIDYKELVNVDGVLITHNHNDHFDELARNKLPFNTPILCQAEDFKSIKKMGFVNITSVDSSISWLGIHIKRFPGTHGGGIINTKLGFSSSYLLSTNKQRIYISGDTLLTKQQRRVLRRVNPKIIIAYGGGAKLNIFGKITMNNEDILELSQLLPDSKIITVHMDSINHCLDRSDMLNKMLTINHLNIIIPAKNEKIELNNKVSNGILNSYKTYD